MGSERGKTWVSLEAESFSCEHVQITHLEGREAISELFKFEVTFVVTEPTEVTEENMLGDRATLSFQYDQEVKRNVHGRIIDVARVFDSSQRFDQYRITIAPHLWGLTMIKQQELYLNMSVPEIIKQKLKAAELGEEHVGFDMRLSRTYPKRDYVVQYRESDFAFISRLMEHEGISYFFEHDGNDKVVFTDNEPSFDPIGGETTVWFSQTGKETDVYHLEETNRFVPANYWLRDYNYVTPQVAVEGTARVDLEWGALGGEILYGQNVRSPEEASSLATIRAEESKARQRIYRGKSDVMRFGAGMTFTLEPPSSKPLNLLVVTLNHRVEQSAMMQGATSEEVDYRNTFEAIPADRTFRPARRTPTSHSRGDDRLHSDSRVERRQHDAKSAGRRHRQHGPLLRGTRLRHPRSRWPQPRHRRPSHTDGPAQRWQRLRHASAASTWNRGDGRLPRRRSRPPGHRGRRQQRPGAQPRQRKGREQESYQEPNRRHHSI